ncbi:hypothetical protein J2T18_004316 [Paenibacillus polymyxa]|nr:hypothetical protein [Paenibacillus polymyxa]
MQNWKLRMGYRSTLPIRIPPGSVAKMKMPMACCVSSSLKVRTSPKKRMKHWNKHYI